MYVGTQTIVLLQHTHLVAKMKHWKYISRPYQTSSEEEENRFFASFLLALTLFCAHAHFIPTLLFKIKTKSYLCYAYFLPYLAKIVNIIIQLA